MNHPFIVGPGIMKVKVKSIVPFEDLMQFWIAQDSLPEVIEPIVGAIQFCFKIQLLGIGV